MEDSITLVFTVIRILYGPFFRFSLILPRTDKANTQKIYVGKLGNAYFKNGEVAGETDFFYGFGTAWVQSTSIALRNCGGGITAWKGTNTTFVNKYGVYIVDSNVHAANASIATVIVGKCALGRPWVRTPFLLPYPFTISFLLIFIHFCPPILECSFPT